MDVYFHLLVIFISVMVSLYHMTALSYDTCCTKDTPWCNGSIFISCDGNEDIHIMNYSIYHCGGNSDRCSCVQTSTRPCSTTVYNSGLESKISSCGSRKECTITETLCTSGGGANNGRVVINYLCSSKSLSQTASHTTSEVTESDTSLEITASNSMLEGTTIAHSTQNSTQQDNVTKSMEPSSFISTTAMIPMSTQLSDEPSSQITSPTISGRITIVQYSSSSAQNSDDRSSVAASIESSGGFLSIMSIETTSLVSIIPIDVTPTSLPSTVSYSNVVSSGIASLSAASPATSAATLSTSIPTKFSTYQETTVYSALISPKTLVGVSSLLETSLASTISPELDNKTMNYDNGLSSLEVTLGVSVPVTFILIIVIVLIIFLRWRKRANRKKQYKNMLHHAYFNIDYNAHTDELAIENPMASVDNGFSDYSEISKVNPPGAADDDTVETGEYNTINLKTFSVRSDPTYGHLAQPDYEVDTTYDSVSRKQTPMDQDDTYAHIGRCYHHAKRRQFEFGEDSTYNTLGDTVSEVNGLPENAVDTDNVYDHTNNVTQENQVSVKSGVTLVYDDVEINLTNDDNHVYKLEGQVYEDINANTSHRDKDNGVEVVEEENELDADTDEEKHTYFILEKLPLETIDTQA